MHKHPLALTATWLDTLHTSAIIAWLSFWARMPRESPPTCYPFCSSNNPRTRNSIPWHPTFTKDQYHQLFSQLKSKEVSIASHSINTIQTNCLPSSTMNGNFFYFTSFTWSYTTTTHLPWVIDTGAIDHMVCNNSYFSIVTSQVSLAVKLPSGDSAPITHIGTGHITPTLILHNVVYIPSFSFNLISAKKLTLSISCYFIFLL